MFRWIFRKIKGDRKYFSIVFFILIMLVVSGIVTDSFVNKTKENWNNKLVEEISSIQSSIVYEFDLKQKDLLSRLETVRQDLRNSLQPENESYKELVKLINDESLLNYSIEVFAPNGKLIAWNQKIAINQDELFPLNFPLGETYFLTKDLFDYLSIIDTVNIDADIFYIAISTPIEENFSINNKYFSNNRFSKYLSDKHGIDITIEYSPYSEKSRDGRLNSFELVNINDNKVGMVSFIKPSLSASINDIKSVSSKIQSLLVLLAILFVGLGLRSDFIRLESFLGRFLLLIFYLVILRIIIFIIGFPSNFISGPLADPTYFSSAFGWGIVKSPVEFFTTIIFVLAISIQFFRYTRNVLSNSAKKHNPGLGIIIFLLSAILIFLIVRGLSSTIKSVVFDSTIRYFKEPNILPDLAALGMNLNILLFGFSILLIILGFVNLSFRFLNFNFSNFNKIKLSLYSLLFTLLIFAGYFVSNDPLITISMLAILIGLSSLLYYQIIIKNKRSVFNYIFILLIASIISITWLNYFNTKLERESLKTTAIEINRTDVNLLSFMLDEILTTLKNDKKINLLFRNKKTNFDALAFALWGESAMQRESLNSGIRFYDREQNIIGEYAIGLDPDKKIFNHLSGDDNIEIVKLKNFNGENYFAGIIKIEERGITQGYISAFANFDIKYLGAVNYPDFIESNYSILNRVVDIKQLKIFQFNGPELLRVYGDVYPSRDQIKEILQTQVDSVFNDAWLKLKFDDESYETYLVKIPFEEENLITVVATAEKAFSWNLFNFFKIFIVHSVFIITGFFILVLLNLGVINLTFKSKLLFSFLIISIIPVVVLALYNTNIVEERAKEGIFNELSQRANYIEKHILSQLQKHQNRDVITAAQNAAQELSISFSIYSATDQVYSSQDIYNRIGLFDRKLNPNAYYHLVYLRYQEFMTAENLNNYKFDSYYKIIKTGNSDYILSVNDAFNKIQVTFSTVEINVVIFGIYSFAVIIIILVSTFFANQISRPIQRLTEATEAVSKGDLSIQIAHNERGEIKELLDGFNQMTSELKKNQIELAEMEREAAWKEMAKQVAHEIKNPLTPMKLALQQLIYSYKDKSKDFDKLFEKVSATVLNQIDNLNQIASEFSRFAKMPSLKLEPINILEVLNDSINMFVHEKVEISLNTKLKAAVVEADLSQLRRMYINLFRNSIQANATKISIELNENENNFKVLFIDNGTGIKVSEKDKIFDENFTTKKQGMGLGLSLAKRFMKSINGQIILISSDQNQTIFEITFLKKEAVST